MEHMFLRASLFSFASFSFEWCLWKSSFLKIRQNIIVLIVIRYHFTDAKKCMWTTLITQRRSSSTIYPPHIVNTIISFLQDNSGDSNTKSSTSAQVNWSPDARQGLSKVSQGPLPTSKETKRTNKQTIRSVRGGRIKGIKVFEVSLKC